MTVEEIIKDITICDTKEKVKMCKIASRYQHEPLSRKEVEFFDNKIYKLCITNNLKLEGLKIKLIRECDKKEFIYRPKRKTAMEVVKYVARCNTVEKCKAYNIAIRSHIEIINNEDAKYFASYIEELAKRYNVGADTLGSTLLTYCKGKTFKYNKSTVEKPVELPKSNLEKRVEILEKIVNELEKELKKPDRIAIENIGKAPGKYKAGDRVVVNVREGIYGEIIDRNVVVTVKDYDYNSIYAVDYKGVCFGVLEKDIIGYAKLNLLTPEEKVMLRHHIKAARPNVVIKIQKDIRCNVPFIRLYISNNIYNTFAIKHHEFANLIYGNVYKVKELGL